MDNLSGNSDDPSTKRILVVEDDESIRDLMEMLLRKEGFMVEFAFDGVEAIAKLKGATPDLVIMDLMMPRSSGFDVLRACQSESIRVPVVVITGKYTDKATQETIRQEANVIEFLQKPIKPASFAFYLHRTLKTRPPLPGAPPA